jgi:hypothetical protein
MNVWRQGALLEVFMSADRVPRRSFFASLLALPLGLAEASQRTSPSPGVAKVAAGAGRFNAVTKLPGGDLLYVKVATQDTAGAFYRTEQPS